MQRIPDPLTAHGRVEEEKLTDDEKMTTTFEELGLDEWVVETCKALAMTTPTEIQVASIPTLLAGQNAIVSAPTGQGKTLCFALPVLQTLAKDPFGVFSVVLTPVRELAYQIQQQFVAVGHVVNLKTCLVVGGKSSGYQANVIVSDRPHVVIATPGRLADSIRTSPDMLRAFSRVKMLVLDEADRLLAGSGFKQDLMDIIKLFPPKEKRQTILVTATVSDEVKQLQSKFGGGERMPLLEDPNNTQEGVLNVVKTLSHNYILVPSLVRMTYLHYLLREVYPTESVIIFTRTIMSCQVVASSIERFLVDLPENAGKVACLHSMLEGQSRRFAALGKFRNQHARILVATDVASRGLDIPTVNVVINFELPTEVPNYVHRVGRAGRAGRSGRAVSLVSENEVELLQSIEAETDITMEPLDKCEEDSVLKLLSATSAARREAESLLHDIGFEDKIKERRKKRKLLVPY
jgi:ATP-dependent RNA helicase DDX49/DBP8